MTQLSKQLSFELKAAGFPQPEPAFGQMWWHPDGGLHVVMKKGDIHTITRYIEDGMTCAGFFNDEAMGEMAFAPNAVDILAEMPAWDAILKTSSSIYECSCFFKPKSLMTFGECPNETIARRYLSLKAEAK